MKVYNETKTEILTSYNEDLGYLKPDKIFVKHHESVIKNPAVTIETKIANIKANGGIIEEIDGISYELVCEYPNGSKDVQEIKETPEVVIDAYDEYEDIQVFIPYTDEEKQKVYKQRVIAYIRKKYDMDDEIALTNDKDSKPKEYAEYQTYREACKSLARKELGL